MVATKKRAAATSPAAASASASSKKKAAAGAVVKQQQQGVAAAGQDKAASRVDRAQALRAAQALLQHHAKFVAERARQAGGAKKLNLLAGDEEQDGEDFIFVQIALARIPERASPKPVPIKLPLPLYRAGTDDHAVCLIVKEADKGKVKRALASPALKDLAGCAEVVGLQELRTDYKEYQERRKLRDAFDLFLVDDRIMPLLGKALGKTFFSKKKHPAPIKLGNALVQGAGEPAAVTLGKRIRATRERTFLHRNHGNCVAVRVARTSMAPEQVVTNLLAGLAQAVEALPGKWKNVMAVSVKSARSVALPIYQRLPQYLINKPKALLPMDPLALGALEAAEGKGKGKKEAAAAPEAGAVKQQQKKGEGKGTAGGKPAASSQLKKRPREAAEAAAPAANKAAKPKGKGKK